MTEDPPARPVRYNIEMFSCPGCRTRIPAPLPQSHWTCPHCKGTHIPFAILRVVAGDDHVRRVDEAQRKPLGIHETKRCLRCGLRLTTLAVPTVSSKIQVEICSRCRFLWYGGGTLREPQAPVASAPIVFDSAAARALEPPDPEEDTVVDWVPSAAPLPTEVEDVFVPATTLVMLTGLAAGGLHALQNWVPTARHYGFFTATPFRHAGLTWLTASLVPNDWTELAWTVLLLYSFGEVIERRLGARHYLRLLLLATFASRLLFHVFVQGHELGALAMVCGVISFQLLTTPHAVLLQGRAFPRGVPAWTLAAVFFTERCFRTPPHEPIAYLGGALGGILAWALVRMPRRGASERRLSPR